MISILIVPTIVDIDIEIDIIISIIPMLTEEGEPDPGQDSALLNNKDICKKMSA